jgi:hypothetical protein
VRPAEFRVEYVVVVLLTGLAEELVGICSIPEFYRMEPWPIAATTNQLFAFRTPIEPTEMMLLPTPRALEPRMPRASMDIVLECEDSWTDRISFINFIDSLAVIAGLFLCRFKEVHEQSEGSSLISSIHNEISLHDL